MVRPPAEICEELALPAIDFSKYVHAALEASQELRPYSYLIHSNFLCPLYPGDGSV